MTLSALSVQTPAKINPVLEVLGRRPDGYHELALVFQTVGLYDEISFYEISEGVRLVIHPSPVHLEVDDSNLIVKAAKLFLKDVLKGRGGVRIELKKRIPLAAGLGGGSSDAAATLKGLDWFFESQVKEEQLQAMAGQLGSDVPFFLTGGAALGTGRGDKITTWLDGFEMPVILVKPPEGLSTPDVYRSGKALITPGEKSRAFQGILREKNLQKIAESLFNGLEPAALFLMPEIGEIKKKLLEAGALGTLVSGSGPTVFAVAQNQEKAEQIACKLEGEGWTVFVTRTITTGVERI